MTLRANRIYKWRDVQEQVYWEKLELINDNATWAGNEGDA